MLGEGRYLQWKAAVAMGCVLFLGTGAMAQESAEVACLRAPDAVSAQEIQSFTTNPQQVLVSNPAGGLRLSESIRGIAGSSSNTLDAVMTLVANASEAQRSSIASGLARVVSACALLGSKEAADYGDKIQAAIAATGDEAFLVAYQSATNDIKVASLGPSSSAAGGGDTTDNPDSRTSNRYRSPGDAPVDTTSASYSIPPGSGFSDDNVNDYGDDSPATSNSGFGQ